MGTVERLVTAVHADMSCDTKQLRVRSFTLQTLEALVRSLCLLVLNKYLAVASFQVLVVLVLSEHLVSLFDFAFIVLQNLRDPLIVSSVETSVVLEHLSLTGLKRNALLDLVFFLLVRLDHSAVFDISSSQEGEQTSSLRV